MGGTLELAVTQDDASVPVERFTMLANGTILMGELTVVEDNLIVRRRALVVAHLARCCGLFYSRVIHVMTWFALLSCA